MRGRKPKPTNIKRLEGNPGKRKLPDEPNIPSDELTCPSHLSYSAKCEWRRLAPQLKELGLLTQLDRAALAGYCEAWGEFTGITKLLKGKSPIIKTANGNIIQNPLLGQKHKALELMHKFLTEFGMSPASRSRIIAEPSKPTDPMDELLETSRNN